LSLDGDLAIRTTPGSIAPVPLGFRINVGLRDGVIAEVGA
jgi:hypothetical protein